ncbi:hypothetical protein PILCRDRAFT_825625 [Piloderma croceum F 1598]|uniref:Uncharacterized protein n=1 Tax=Piloderma croceum (strain F 1598) TaxID=765440 RepID=A0A0C3EX69_PILCF|nr:hypothetical protein PILCRDRAFT_825625 [Piloderma croceum F 1598]
MSSYTSSHSFHLFLSHVIIIIYYAPSHLGSRRPMINLHSSSPPLDYRIFIWPTLGIVRTSIQFMHPVSHLRNSTSWYFLPPSWTL